jgi:LDH2 family malate/lactate/ureidoglycolate dehydrogenase
MSPPDAAAGAPQETRVPYEALDDFTRRVLERLGLPSADAETVTAVLSQTNLRGVETHGTDMLPIYVGRLRHGIIKPTPKMTIVKETAAMALIDGDQGAGQVTSVFAMNTAIDKARQAGIGWVNVRNSNHQGALAYYSLMAAEQGMIGITSSTTTTVMVPWGSREAIASNAPMAYALPSDRYETPVLDMASSVHAYGKVRLAQERNVALPEGMAVDAEGNLTIDPFKAVAAVSFGDYKGSGLMMVFAALSGLLSGEPFTAQRPAAGQEKGFAAQVAHLLVAVNVESFTDLGEFKTSLDDVIAGWKRSALRPGFDEVFYPGEIEWRRVPERKANGIPVNESLLSELKAVGQDLGVPFPEAA